MTRPTNDLVAKRARRPTERLRRQGAYQQATDEIPQDQYFPITIRWVVEESLRLQYNQYPYKGNSLSSLRDAESILQTRNARREERWEPGKDYQRESDRNMNGAQSEQRRIEEHNRTISGFQSGNMAKVEASNTRKVYCYYCRQDGLYKSQCPVKTNKKQPAINMVIAEVANIRQVTTRSKGNGRMGGSGSNLETGHRMDREGK